MICKDKVYVSTNITIPITFTGVLTSDISDLYVKFVNRSDPTIHKAYLYSTGGITIVGDEISVVVDKVDITTAGMYDIYMKRTDQSGNELGVVPCPSMVQFHQML